MLHSIEEKKSHSLTFIMKKMEKRTNLNFFQVLYCFPRIVIYIVQLLHSQTQFRQCQLVAQKTKGSREEEKKRMNSS